VYCGVTSICTDPDDLLDSIVENQDSTERIAAKHDVCC